MLKERAGRRANAPACVQFCLRSVIWCTAVFDVVLHCVVLLYRLPSRRQGKWVRCQRRWMLLSLAASATEVCRWCRVVNASLDTTFLQTTSLSKQPLSLETTPILSLSGNNISLSSKSFSCVVQSGPDLFGMPVVSVVSICDCSLRRRAGGSTTAQG